MHIKPTESNGREIKVACSYLNMLIEVDAGTSGPVRIVDADGKEVGRGRVKVLTPATVPAQRSPAVTDAQQAHADARRAICETCDQNGGLSRYTVKCNGCGCAGLSLLNGVCKLGKWPIDAATG